MSIRVTCPGCHKRFNVSEKFAGKTGPCPKCKTPMKIPALEDKVVIHETVKGATDSKGKKISEPIKREETKISSTSIVISVAACLLIPMIAWVLGKTMGFEDADGIFRQPTWLLATGAILLAGPVVWAGYTFLRNQELEPYRGMPLLKRVAICATVYAGLWGLHLYMTKMLYGAEISTPEVLVALPILFIPGALASLATLDLDGTSAAIHYGFYMLVTVGLRLLMGLPPL